MGELGEIEVELACNRLVIGVVERFVDWVINFVVMHTDDVVVNQTGLRINIATLDWMQI